jgi:hypothetical protein
MSTIFEDNFNSYNNGDLIGQGNWIDIYAGNLYDVEDSLVKEGAKAVISPGGMGSTQWPRIYKMGNSLSAGRITCYIRKTATNTPFLFMIEHHADFTGAIVRFNDDGNIEYFNGAAYVAIQAYSAGQWYCVEVQWIDDSGTKKARYRIDEGSWTDYYAINGNPSELDSVRLFRRGDDYSYIDYIAENPIVPPAAGRSFGFIL